MPRQNFHKAIAPPTGRKKSRKPWSRLARRRARRTISVLQPALPTQMITKRRDRISLQAPDGDFSGDLPVVTAPPPVPEVPLAPLFTNGYSTLPKELTAPSSKSIDGDISTNLLPEKADRCPNCPAEVLGRSYALPTTRHKSRDDLSNLRIWRLFRWPFGISCRLQKPIP